MFHLEEANAALVQVKRLSSSLKYRSVKNGLEGLNSAHLLSFSYASTSASSYDQTGLLTGLYFQDSTFHTLGWYSGKQRRVSFSSVGADILSSADSADRSLLLSEGLKTILNRDNSFPFVLTVDSFGLYSTITTLHENRDYRLRHTVSRIRESFESCEISVMQWIPGPRSVADALTEINPNIFRIRNDVMKDGVLPEVILSSSERSIGTMASALVDHNGK